MVLPEGADKMDEKQLAEALEKKSGYSKEAAAYLAAKIKGSVVDENTIL